MEKKQAQHLMIFCMAVLFILMIYKPLHRIVPTAVTVSCAALAVIGIYIPYRILKKHNAKSRST